MQSLRRISISMFRWTWLAALLLFAFAFLVSGLSKPQARLPVTTQPVSADSQSPESLPSQYFPAEQQKTSEYQESSQTDLLGTIVQLNEARLLRLEKLKLPTADQADWMAICRRMSLGLVGTGLSLEEIRSLESVPEDLRPSVHLEHLFQDPRFHYYWAERWTRFFVGTDEGPFIVYRRRRFRTWLAETFANNVPYNQLASDLITAKGLWTDRPEVNFYTVTYINAGDDPDPIRLAARTSRVFLGLRIDCLQCHDDFLGNVSLGSTDAPREGLQSDFHQLAAFFTAAKANGFQGIRDGEANYRFKYLYATEEVDVEPSVPYLQDQLPEIGTPRERLAAWITSPQNRQAARSTVSHVWALLFGRPIDETIDNLPLDQAMSGEMEILVDDFINHGFDVRRLIRLIALSEAFQVSSRAEFHVTARHDAAGAVFPLIRLRPEQIAGRMIQSSRIKTINGDSSTIIQLQKLLGTNDFVKQYGDQGEDEFANESMTITQRLIMLNGELLDNSVDYNPFMNATAHIAMFSDNDSTIINNAYLCVLNRTPSETEFTHFVNRLNESINRQQTLEDLFWSLLNSSEFAWNH